jgi:hypothetical protein
MRSKWPDALRDNVLRKVVVASIAVVFGVAAVVLPPVVNRQLADAEKILQKPLAGLLVAIAIVVVSAWRYRFAIAIAAAIVLITAVQITYYFVTTSPGRTLREQASSWRVIPVASGAHGIAESTPDVFGRASLFWAGDRIRLDLHSTTGTTQQGFYLNGGGPASKFLFSADVTRIDGGHQVVCPLLFGIRSNRDYYTFRLQDSGTSPVAKAYHIIPNSPVFTSGFHGEQVGDTPPLPYVNRWNIFEPSQLRTTRMMIEGDGSYYRFFINDREVLGRRIDDVPNHTVAVGVTVLANDLVADAACNYSHVSLWVAP